MNNQNSKLFLGISGLIFFIVIVTGLFFLASSTAGATGAVLAYVAGLSMIFLPCTLPLAFIIVPLTMGQKPKKGIIMALLFGLGISITLALYGVFIASIGAYLGLDKATRIMFSIAGFASLLFGFTELKLASFTMPSFSGALPRFVQERKDYAKIFLMGLFLGNAGVGCPNPAFYVLLTYIASTGNMFTGGWLAFIHGVGRATPLIFLAILGLLGVNSLQWITRKKASVDVWMGWVLVAVGSFIFTYGIFGMPWWEDSIFHANWNAFVYNIAPALAEALNHPIAQGFFVGSFWAGWTLFLGIIIFTILWAVAKKTITKTKAYTIATLLLFMIFLATSGAIQTEHAHGVDDIGVEHSEVINN